MKGTIAILGCLLAAYAAPLFANEVPLILDETIQLPAATPYWDLISLDSTYYWVTCDILDDGRQVLRRNCSNDTLVFDDFDPNSDGEVFHVYLYNHTDVGVAIGFSQESPWHDPGLTIWEFPCDNPDNVILYTCHKNGGLCRVGPQPGLRIYCNPHVSYVSSRAPAPEQDNRLRWFVNNSQCGSDELGTSCYDLMCSPFYDDEWDCLQDWYYSYGTVVCDYQSEEDSLYGWNWHSSGSSGFENFGVAMGRIYVDSVAFTVERRGEARATICTIDQISGHGVLVAAFESATCSWHEEYYPDTLWAISPSYDRLYFVNIAWDENEEILALRSNSTVFDVIHLLSGNIWGQTSPLDSGFAEMKIVGRYHNETRRLVVRYGSELRIYRFGDPIYTDADDARPELPNELTLSAYPNPFNPTTMIGFDLPKAGRVSLVVYDLNGRLVQTLLDEQMSGGQHEVGFDGAALPSGIYFARLVAGDLVKTQKMVLLK